MHINDGITIKCGYLNCDKTYNKVNSFSSHVTTVQKLSNSNIRSNNVDSSNTVVESDNNSIDNLLSVSDNDQYYEQNNSDVFLINLAHFFFEIRIQVFFTSIYGAVYCDRNV